MSPALVRSSRMTPRALRRFSAGTRLSGLACNSRNLVVSVRMRLSTFALSFAPAEPARPSNSMQVINSLIPKSIAHRGELRNLHAGTEMPAALVALDGAGPITGGAPEIVPPNSADFLHIAL